MGIWYDPIPWNNDIKMAFTFYGNLNGQTFKRYSIAIGMGLRNAANSKTPFDIIARGENRFVCEITWGKNLPPKRGINLFAKGNSFAI